VLQISIVADYQEDLPSHDATDAAILHAARSLGINYATEWIPTDLLDTADPAHVLRFTRALLVGPGSPYISMQGALNAIRIFRESGRPLLGTCGGFQHVVIEYARNLAGIADAEHAEYDPASGHQVIRALPCSLAGKTLHVDLAPGSLARRIYCRDQIQETYHCIHGLDPAYRAQLEAAGLRVTGVEAAGADDGAGVGTGGSALAESVGEARIVELPTHPFFLATLFVPQMRSTREDPHPLFVAFLRAALESKVPCEERPIFDDESASEES
jgi:CTP synthase (UTP-ammonia lyase)